MAINIAEDSMFESRISEIITKDPYTITANGPTQLLNHLYIGNYADAYNKEKLKRHGITHVLNCAAFKNFNKAPYSNESGILAYLQFHAQDKDTYQMLQHYDESKAFIDHARATRGKVLVHCAMGINRSGIICLAYIMDSQNLDLLEAVNYVKDKRGIILCNRGFQRELIRFARQRGLLYPPKTSSSTSF